MDERSVNTEEPEKRENGIENNSEADEKATKKYIKMTTEKVEGLILKLAVPTILSMLISSFYNLVDAKFVGTLESETATSAVGIAFTVMTIIQAVGFFFGHGSGNYISRALGSKSFSDAEKMASTGFYTAFGAGAVMLVLGQIFAVPIATVIGARDPETLKYTLDYMRVILFGAPFMCAQLVLNNQLRFQGNAVFAMLGILSGGIVNIGLDALFVSVMELEVLGAALATLMGQIISFVALYIGTKKSDNVKISLKNFTPSKKYYGEIVRGGTPSLVRQCMGSVSTSIMNNIAFEVGGSAAQAATSIVTKITHFISSSMIGFGQGFQPVCGFNYGAGLYKRVKRSFWFCVWSTTAAFVFIAAMGYIFAPGLAAFIQSGESDEIGKVIKIATDMLRCHLLVLPLMPFVIMSNMMLQTIGKVGSASLLAMCRQGLAFIPSVLILSSLTGLQGFVSAQAVADILSLIISVPVTIPVLNKMRKNNGE